MKEKQDIIIRYFHSGESIRSISKNTGKSRRTVSKYIKEYEESQKEIKQAINDGKDEISEFIEDLVKKPKYNSSNRKKRKLTQEIVDEVQNCLKMNRLKKEARQHKQIMKKIDIYEMIKRKGYDIGYTTISTLINRLEDKKKEVFIKQNYEMGDVCEFDWCEVKIHLDGKLKRLYLGLFTSAYSGFRYARLFYKQNTQAFQEAHALFFEYTGGVYKTIRYDNMKVAVKKFVGRSEKEPTEALLKLSMYYGYKYSFCNVGKGNEKGHVERDVEYVRRKTFCEKDDFKDIDKANEFLQNSCDVLNDICKKARGNKTNFELFVSELEFMTKAAPKFECADIKTQRVDKYSTVRLDTCNYSVPEEYVKKIVDIKVYSSRIIIFHNDIKLCRHIKLNERHKWQLDIDHYLKTLDKKPGALKNGLAFKQTCDDLKTIYKKYYTGCEKDFICLLKYMKENNKTIKEILEKIKKLEQISPRDINTDKIKAMCDRKDEALEEDKNNMSETKEKSLSGLATITSMLINPNKCGMGVSLQ